MAERMPPTKVDTDKEANKARGTREVNRFGVISDFIPSAGHIDDAAVVAATIASIRGDVESFKSWERSQKGARQ